MTTFILRSAFVPPRSLPSGMPLARLALHRALRPAALGLAFVLSAAGCSSDDAAQRRDDAPAGSSAEASSTGQASAAGAPPPFDPEQRPSLVSAEPHAFSALDLLNLDRLGTPVPSVDGSEVFFTRRTTLLAENKGVTTLWSVPAAGGEPRQRTTHPKGASSPQPSPDGEHLYFLSARSGQSQVWRLGLRREGAVPEQMTDLPLDVGAYRLSPDGKTLIVTVDVFLDCETSEDALTCTKARLDAIAASGESGQAYDRIFVRHWDTWKDGRRGQLFALPADAPKAKMATWIAHGLTADVPPKPWWGEEAFVVTPDHRSVVFVAKDAASALEPVSTNYDLYVAPLDGSAPAKRITENPAWDDHPVFSPDGKTLAYVAMERAGFEADRLRILLLPWEGSAPGGPPKVLTAAWDRSAGDLVWAKDGASLLVTAYDTLQHPLFRVDAKTGAVTPLVSEGYVSGPAEVKGADGAARLVFAKNDLAHPDELFTATLGGSDVAALTHVNDARLEKVARGTFAPFSFVGAKKQKVHGFVVKPAGFEEGKRYPLAVLLHGGPQGSFANRFHYRWNPQTYAGAGFAVVTIDFHGSVGYGQAFTDAIRGDWGGGPLEDVQKGLAAVLKENPWIDGGNACALGASYGGYLINWIAGAWPDRFRCLVNHDGIFDQRSMYYATEELWFPEWEHGGPYYEAAAGHERHNPASLVKKWKTPVLIVHGAQDHRVPLEQGLQTFNALQRRGVESRLLMFPDENHWVVKPKNSLQWHREVESWLLRYTATRQTTPAPVN